MSGTVSNIIAKYDDVMEKTVALYKVRARQYGLDLDDFRQVCRITIWNCLKQKKETEPEFVPYIKTSMRKALRSYIVKNTTGKSQQAVDKSHSGKFLCTSELLIKPCDDASLIWETVKADLPGSEDSVKGFLAECEKKDPVLKEIIDMRLKGYKGDYISKAENISYPTYLRRMRTIKDMYCEYFEENENGIKEKFSGNKCAVAN